jgi:predicted ATPase/DNA-binding CsgD family transcriptional regulator
MGETVRGEGGNLPAPLTSFVGRDRHLGQLARLLEAQRLVTLVGVGGVGKTRLALAAVAGTVDRLDDGARFVELGALADPGSVPRAVAGAFGLQEQHGRSATEVLAAALRSRQPLLVLDSCEHLLLACARIVEQLLRSCPGLRVLATSREALGVPGETVWRVPPLSLPYPGQPSRPDQLLRSEAVRLFVDRARSVRPDFALTASNAAAVTEICCRLDGLPLAIELAAARTGVLAVEQISDRLSDRFALLTAGPSIALPRQQTLRGTLDWSYGLLAPDGRDLLNRLAVCAGGWTLEAAEALRGDGDGRGALEILADLVGKSLVVADVAEGAPARYRLMETVREYAAEQLAASGVEADARRRHAAYFVSLAEQAEPALRGPDQLPWLDRLDRERENLRTAFDWSMSPGGDVTVGLRLVAALGWFWYLRGDHREGRDWWERPDRPVDEAALAGPLGARVLTAVGFLAATQYDLVPARRLLEAASALARRTGDRRLIGAALARLGYLTMHEERPDAAAELLGEALDHHRAADDAWGAAFVLMALGHVALHRGDPVGAAPLARESRALFRGLGDRWGVARALHGVGQAAFDLGDYGRAEAAWRERVELSRGIGARNALAHGLDLVGTAARRRGDRRRAAACYQESLRLRRAAGDHRATAWTLHYLALLACQDGDAARARPLLTESLALRREAGEPRWIALALEGFAGLAVVDGRPRAALRLAGAATALRAAADQPRTALEEADLRPWLERAEQRLGAPVAAALQAEGEALGLEDAVDLLLSAAAEPGGAATRPPSDGEPERLTAREREVVGLIARGLSNRRIAERLVIAPGTAGVHVAHVLAKLGLHTRAQVAVWAVAHGLAAPEPDRPAAAIAAGDGAKYIVR